MTWVKGLPCAAPGISLRSFYARPGLTSVSTMALRPCLVTDKKVWPCAAAFMASTAMSIEPSVPFLNPTAQDRADASSR